MAFPKINKSFASLDHYIAFEECLVPEQHSRSIEIIVERCNSY